MSSKSETQALRLQAIHAEQFRNLALVHLPVGGRDTFLIGPNAQGKTNLLEAIGLVTSLRSFRTRETAALVHHSAEQARLLQNWQIAGNPADVLLRLHRKGKQVSVDKEPVRRLADFVGRFPTTTLCNEDIQLIRSGPAIRRRWLDMTLSAASSSYLLTLHRYNQALKERNRLLKQPTTDSELAAFDKPLAEAAHALHQLRQTHTQQLADNVRRAYQCIAEGDAPVLHYAPNEAVESPEAFLEILERRRRQDQRYATTQTGPHRDDLALRIRNNPALHYASEGQQRSLVIALRLAEFHFLSQARNTIPVLLIDDIISELDPQRQAHFWASVPASAQVIATGTRPPPDGPREWQRWHVSEGTFTQGH